MMPSTDGYRFRVMLFFGAEAGWQESRWGGEHASRVSDMRELGSPTARLARHWIARVKSRVTGFVPGLGA